MKYSNALGVAALLALCGSAAAAIVTNPNDPRSFQGATVGTFASLYYGADTLANRQLVCDNQLLDDSIFNPVGYAPATLVNNAWAQFSGAYGGRSNDTTGTGSYGYTYPDGSTLMQAANGIDNLWFQSGDSPGQTVFDLGSSVLNAAVFPVIDHGPLPQETIESTVYLSDSPTGPWTEAHVLRVFLEGFHPNTGILWDGFTFVVGTGLNTSFRYASIIHGGPAGLINDGDDEINGMVGFNDVPAPGAAGLLGVAALASAKRRRR